MAPLRVAYQETKNTSDVSCVSCWVGDADSASSPICFVLQVLTCMVRYLPLMPFETAICTKRCTVIKNVEESKCMTHTLKHTFFYTPSLIPRSFEVRRATTRSGAAVILNRHPGSLLYGRGAPAGLLQNAYFFY